MAAILDMIRRQTPNIEADTHLLAGEGLAAAVIRQGFRLGRPGARKGSEAAADGRGRFAGRAPRPR